MLPEKHRADTEADECSQAKRRRNETTLEMAERHVAEGRKRVERQQQIAGEMERHTHPQAAKRARATLALFQENLRLAIEHLELERARNRQK